MMRELVDRPREELTNLDLVGSGLEKQKLGANKWNGEEVRRIIDEMNDVEMAVLEMSH